MALHANWSPGFTAAYFDQTGLYSFARQAEAIHWDVAQLAHALQNHAELEPLVEILRRFPQIYEERLIARFLWRIGHDAPDAATGRAFVEAAVIALRDGDILIDRFFFDARRGDLSASAYPGPAWDQVRADQAALSPRTGHLDHAYWSGDTLCSMHIDEVEAIWSHIGRDDDWQPLHDKIAAIRAMGAAHGEAPTSH